MPSSKSPQAKAIGEIIKGARLASGLTQRQLAAAIGRENDSGLLSRWESGERKASPDDVAQIIEALKLDSDTAANLAALAAGTDKPQALAISAGERRQQLNAVIRAEGRASVVTYVAPLLPPGVCQTNEVIRALMIAGEVPESELDERVIVRIGRRDLYTRRDPARVVVYLGEAAIRVIIGTPRVWADQLRYLLALADLSNIEILAVPFSAGWTPMLTGHFALYDDDLVNIEVQGTGLLFSDPADVERHRAAVARVQEKAMSSEATRGLIATVITELEKCDDDTPQD